MPSPVVPLPESSSTDRAGSAQVVSATGPLERLPLRGPGRAASLAGRVAAAVVAALVWGLVPALPAQAAADPAPRVTDVTTSHPRLMENGSGFASLTSRVSSDGVSADLYATVLKKADSMLGASVVTYSKPDGARLLDTSRTVLDRSYTLLVAWKVSGKTKYIDRLQRDLDAAASFPNWNPDHFLDTAEMTQAFAISYDWGYSHWSTAERNKLRQAILNKGLTPSLKVYAATSVDAAPYKYGGNWAMRSDNVNIVVNSAMAMGALAVARDTSSSLPQQILDKSFASIRVGLRAYGPDGGFKEGPTYWEYATRYLTSFLASLKTSTGRVYGLTSASGLSQTATFMQAMTGPGGQYYGYADSITAFQPAAAYAGLASVFGDANRMALAASVKSSAYAPLQLVLRDPAVAARAAAPTSTPLQNTFTAAGVTSMTGSRTDRRASYAAFRFGADPAGSHQHFDGGDFGFQALGQEWAVDLGMDSGTYDLLAENRSTTRWNYYRTRAEGHNTLAIDPFDPNAGNKTGTTKLINKGSDVDSAYAVADLSAAYPDKVSSWKRGVRLFDNRSQLLVQDEITAKGSIEALWSMHTAAKIQVASDGRSAVLLQNGERVLARIVSPGGQTFVRMAAAPLPTSPSVTQTPNTGISKLAIDVKGSQKVTVAVQLTPLRHGSTTQSASAPVVPNALGSWGVAGATAPLSGIKVDGTAVPGFRADQSSYTVAVPNGRVPVVSATAPAGKVAVQQAASVPGRAKITVSGAGGAATSYVVYLEPAKLKITKASASVVSSGYASATFDGSKKTYWGANASTATITWELARPTDVDSVVFSWRANSAKKTVYEVATSTDKKTWVQRYASQYVGGSSDQAVRLSSGSTSRYVRLTVHGDRAKVKTSMLDEVQLFDYDVRRDYSSAAASRPSAVAVKGVPSSMTTGQLALAAPKATWTGSAGKATYRYVSSNPAAATVDGHGLVTAKNGGKTRIGVLATSAGTTVTSSVGVAVADTTKVRLYAVADTYVQSSAPSGNYGKQYGMLVKPNLSGSASANRVGYLRFDVSKLAGKTVSSAVLNTESVITDNTTSPSTERIDVRAASGSWSESSLTYAKRPALGSTVGSFTAERTKKRTAANVSAYVASAAKSKKADLTMGLTQEAVRPALLTTVSSKESGAGAYLDVTLTPAPLKVSSAVASATTSGSAAATFDGNPSTAWRVDKNPGWVRWQLASPTHVASTELSWKANSAKKTVFEVETSNDTGTWTRRYAGQYVGSSGKQTVSLSSGISVKYVRLVVHGNGGSVKTSMLNDVKLLGYDATAAAPSVPSTILKSVSLDGLGSTLALGSTTQAKATARDTVGNTFSKATVTYSSSNPTVAKVSSTGAVTAAATGSATISVKATANGVTVTDSVAVKVTDATKVRIYAQADTYVQSSTPSTNFGGEHGMLVKPNAKANRVAYLRFDLTQLAGRTVSSAKLTTESVIVDGTTSPSTVRVHAHSASGSWSENTLTYPGRPTLGATLGSFVATRTKATASTSLTSPIKTLAAKRTSTLTLGLTEDGAGTSARLVNVSTRESPSKGAYIDVVLVPGK